MSVEQHQHSLFECFNNGQDPRVQEMAGRANSYTEMFKTGQISKEEYVELMEDISREINIANSVANQQLLIHMNTAINGLISLAKLV